MKKQLLSKISALFVTVGMLLFAQAVWADDVDDVMAFLDRYAELENDLEAQADMIRSDRVMIAGSARQTDQAKNMAVQIAQSDANGGARLVVRVEAPEVRVYGNTAVASFMRLTNVFPADGGSVNPGPLWVTLVLVKERGNWQIAHTHISPVVPPNN
jgi:ketosteroid isomerase-like protein